MKYFLVVLIISSFSRSLFAQMSDSFDDGDFTNNPTWTGNTEDFIVNPNLELQLNSDEPGDSYLSTEHHLSDLENKEWNFKIKYTFNPSNNNRGNTYLTAENADLSTDPDGIYFRIGENGSDDPIELIERKEGTETTILTSTPGIVAEAFDIRVKIIYTAEKDWELYVDLSGNEIYILDASTNYPTDIVGTHVGVQLKYTTTNTTGFIYDDFYVGDIQVDEEPPNLSNVQAISTTELNVYFDETVEIISAEEINNYTVNKGIGKPNTASLDNDNPTMVLLTFEEEFVLGETYKIISSNVEDLAGNSMITQSLEFMYVEAENPEFGDIIINEFLVRKTPSVGLPEAQYVELYNRSDKYFNVKDWKLSDNNSAGTIQEAWLYPGEYLVLTPTSNLNDFEISNITNVTSWATLNLTGDEIHLTTNNGVVVDELTYTDAWYQDEEKAKEGWSIERINPELPCSTEKNWRASEASIGGTPGEKNSVYDTAPDTLQPEVIDVFAALPNLLTLEFSKGMDSLSLMNMYVDTELELTEVNRSVDAVFPTKISIQFDETFEVGKVYEFALENFSDCSGNNNDYTGYFVIPEAPQQGDLIINEILFNPPVGGSDFVEIYNNSERFIDMKGWELAHAKDGEMAAHKEVEENYILAPNDYVVLTKDVASQLENYPTAVEEKFIEMAALPSYNNDSSTVYLIYNDTVMDKVSYSEDWHFPLLSSKKGVSLERFSPAMPSNDASSWHSASESVNFATPGRKNSQEIKPGQEAGELSLSSKTLSPDGDGFEDVVLITYKVTAPNLVGDMTIYNDKGRKIKTLFHQRLLDTEETVKWDGTTEDGNKAFIGPHIILLEIFDLEQAKVNQVRTVVTVAGRL